MAWLPLWMTLKEGQKYDKQDVLESILRTLVWILILFLISLYFHYYIPLYVVTFIVGFILCFIIFTLLFEGDIYPPFWITLLISSAFIILPVLICWKYSPGEAGYLFSGLVTDLVPAAWTGYLVCILLMAVLLIVALLLGMAFTLAFKLLKWLFKPIIDYYKERKQKKEP